VTAEVRFAGERLRAPDGRIVVPRGRHHPYENSPSPTEVAALVADILRKHIDPIVGDTYAVVPLPVPFDLHGGAAAPGIARATRPTSSMIVWGRAPGGTDPGASISWQPKDLGSTR